MKQFLFVSLLLFVCAFRAGAASAKPISTDWWSLQPLVRPAVPEVQSSKFKVQNPIDAFVAAKLSEQKLESSPEAEPRVLIRRLYFDLLGLPPKPEEVEAFVAEFTASLHPSVSPSRATDGEMERQRDRVIEALVDRLLASPHSGERWARHWLDLVRYAESRGHEFDYTIPNAFQYRDYVIRSFNADKPWNEFVVEQLAGDELLAPPYANLSPERFERYGDVARLIRGRG